MMISRGQRLDKRKIQTIKTQAAQYPGTRQVGTQKGDYMSNLRTTTFPAIALTIRRSSKEIMPLKEGIAESERLLSCGVTSAPLPASRSQAQILPFSSRLMHLPSASATAEMGLVCPCSVLTKLSFGGDADIELEWEGRTRR
jgi:hypothetical protein